MRYKELLENYAPEEDSKDTIKLSDTRVARLTLIHLSKLRNIREYRKFENSKRTERLKRMYSAPSDGGDADLSM